MSNVPRELLFDILSRLQPKELIRYVCVSKAWHALILDQEFIKAQLESSIKTNTSRTILLTQDRLDSTTFSLCSDRFTLAFHDNDSFDSAVKVQQPLRSRIFNSKVLGYSNGLVCIQQYSILNRLIDFVIWNPSIQNIKNTPSPTFQQQQQQQQTSLNVVMKLHRYGFGYDSTNDDYKLVGYAKFDDIPESFLEVQITCLAMVFHLVLRRDGVFKPCSKLDNAQRVRWILSQNSNS